MQHYKICNNIVMDVGGLCRDGGLGGLGCVVMGGVGVWGASDKKGSSILHRGAGLHM